MADENEPVGRWSWVSRGLAVGGVLLLVALLVFGVATQGSSDRIDQSLAEGEAPPAPGFDLPVLDRGSVPRSLRRSSRTAFVDGGVDREELEGTPLVLNFWASWCVPCREEAPVLEAGWQRHGPTGVLYLGVDMQDITDDALEFIEEFEITYPTIRDPTRDVAVSYGATGIPETYFIDAEGRVVGHVVGVVSARQLDEGARAASRGVVAGTESGGAQRPQR